MMNNHPFESGLDTVSRLQERKNRGQVSQQRANTYAQSAGDRSKLNSARIEQIRARIAQMPQQMHMQQQRIDNDSIMTKIQELGLQLKERELKDKENGVFQDGGGKGSTMRQAQQDIKKIVDQFSAYDSKTGSVDMSKIPAYYQQEINQNLQYIQKQGGNPLAMKRVLQFANVQSTISGVDISPLQHYSGVIGKGRLKRDSIASGLGHSSKEFNDYQTLVGTIIPIAMEQIGQAFGGSVQEYATQVRQQAMHDPSWTHNPELVKSQWEALVNIATSEGNNAKAMATNPNFISTGDTSTAPNAFSGKGGSQSQPSPQPSSQDSSKKDTAEAVKKVVTLKRVGGGFQ